MTPQPTSPQDDHKDERRRLLILAVLLFLAIGCLVCNTARFATSQIEVNTGQSEVLSRLNADYSIWELVRFAPVDPAIIAEALQDRGWVVPTQVAAEEPSRPGGATPSPTREPPTAATATPTRPPRPTPASSPTATPRPTATDTSIPTDTPLPPPPPTNTPVTGSIAGVLRNDLDYAGGDGTADGVCDATMQGVRVELHRGSSPTNLVAWVLTDASCAYEFNPTALGAYTIRVDGATFNGPAGTLPEQTFANGASALGGQDPGVSDDHWVTVNFTGVDISNVDFGFSYEAVVNENASGQGALEQAILNANLIAGADTIVFASPLGPYTITPDTGGFSDITDAATTINGTMTTVTLDGGGLAADGLSVQATDVTIQGLTIQSFAGNGILVGGVAGVADNAVIQNCTITLNTGSGVWLENADGFRLRQCTLEDNINPPVAARGQMEIHGSSAGGIVEDCLVVEDPAVNSGGADGIRFDSTAPSGWIVQNNEIYGHQNSSNNEGIIVRGTDHQIIANISHDNYTGIAVAEDASDRNLVSQNSIYSNIGSGITLNGCPGTTPNECLAAPTLTNPSGRIVQAGFTPLSPYLSPATVEFFRAVGADAAGEGVTFCFAVTDSDLDTVVQVDLDDPGIIAGPCGLIGSGNPLTATLIDSTNNTSEFATNLAAP